MPPFWQGLVLAGQRKQADGRPKMALSVINANDSGVILRSWRCTGRRPGVPAFTPLHGNGMNLTLKLMALSLALLCTRMAGAAEQLLEQLRIDQAALVVAERDFRSRRESNTLTDAEASDYAAYVARLVKRVAEDCMALAQTGRLLPADVQCPALPPVARPAAIDQDGEQTHAEHTAALDAELNAGLGEFDELLLREQERVRASAPRSQGGSGGAGQGDTGTGSGATGEASGVSSETAGSGADSGQNLPGSAGEQQASTDTAGGPGTAGQTVASGQPADVPDGSDDDVVARQLREAAEKETDPELKKKLWEEYKKYKQGTR